MQSIIVTTFDALLEALKTNPDLIIFADAVDGQGEWHATEYFIDHDEARVPIEVSHAVFEQVMESLEFRFMETRIRTSKRYQYYCGRNYAIDNDLAVNGGFPPGMSYRDLLPGAVLELMWEDAPTCYCLVTSVEEQPFSYRGPRKFTALDDHGVAHDCTHQQIVALISNNELKTVLAHTEQRDARRLIENVQRSRDRIVDNLSKAS